MKHVFCKAFSTSFSRHELSVLIVYSAFIAEDSKGEVNFILVSTDIVMAEVFLSPPEYDDVEIVILPNGESTQEKYISVSELMTRLRNRKRGNVTHIDV